MPAFPPPPFPQPLPNFGPPSWKGARGYRSVRGRVGRSASVSHSFTVRPISFGHRANAQAHTGGGGGGGGGGGVLRSQTPHGGRRETTRAADGFSLSSLTAADAAGEGGFTRGEVASRRRRAMLDYSGLLSLWYGNCGRRVPSFPPLFSPSKPSRWANRRANGGRKGGGRGRSPLAEGGRPVKHSNLGGRKVGGGRRQQQHERIRFVQEECLALLPM